MMYYAQARKMGFTLIEIMIVIAIIAILAGIAIPNIMAARAEARLESCKGNIRYIYESLEMYSVRHPHPCNRPITVRGTGVSLFDDGTISYSHSGGTTIGYEYNLFTLPDDIELDDTLCCPEWDATYWIQYYFLEDKEAWISSGWQVQCGAWHVMSNGHEFVPFYPAINGVTEYCCNCEGACRM